MMVLSLHNLRSENIHAKVVTGDCGMLSCRGVACYLQVVIQQACMSSGAATILHNRHRRGDQTAKAWLCRQW